MAPWDPASAGVLRLPSGRLVRGRSLRRPLPVGDTPDLSVVALGAPPASYGWSFDWDTRWLRWPDFGLPHDVPDTVSTLRAAWARAWSERVEVGCAGGRGRTGTVLACLAVLDGVPADEAVAFVRRHYHRLAVETPAQARFVRRFPPE